MENQKNIIKASDYAVPEMWRQRYCDALSSGNLLEVRHVSNICGDKVLFPIATRDDCTCWIDRLYLRHTDAVEYPDCRCLADRIVKGTCDCIGQVHDTVVWFSSLHIACYYGQLQVVQLLLELNPMSIYTECPGIPYTPLMVVSLSATKDVAPSIASLLIDNGANIDEQEEKDFAALHFAVIKRNEELVRLYVQNRCNVNILALRMVHVSQRWLSWCLDKRKCGFSPLWFAAALSMEMTDCEKQLLDAGASVVCGGACCCPLVVIGRRGDLPAAKRYIKSGGYRFNSPLDANKFMSIVVRLYQCDPFRGKRKQNQRTWFEIIKCCLAVGIDVNAEDENGNTVIYDVLFCFCKAVVELLVELLLSYGANVNHANFEGVTPLMHGIYIRCVDFYYIPSLIRFLLKSGADPNSTDKDGHNVLWYAVSHGQFKKCIESDIKLLLDSNVDVNHDSRGSHILHWACRRDEFVVADLLLEYGIDMTKQDWLFDIKKLPRSLIANNAKYKDLVKRYRNPEKLIVLCRNKLRRLLGKDIKYAVATLSLPKALRNFLMVKSNDE